MEEDRRTRMSGIPVEPQQRADKVGPVGEPRSASLRSLPFRPSVRPASCIFGEPLISLVIFKTGPPRLAAQFRARRGPLLCSALHASICKN